jgi:hypothetical protein
MKIESSIGENKRNGSEKCRSNGVGISGVKNEENAHRQRRQAA